MENACASKILAKRKRVSHQLIAKARNAATTTSALKRSAPATIIAILLFLSVKDVTRRQSVFPTAILKKVESTVFQNARSSNAERSTIVVEKRSAIKGRTNAKKSHAEAMTTAGTKKSALEMFANPSHALKTPTAPEHQRSVSTTNANPSAALAMLLAMKKNDASSTNAFREIVLLTLTVVKHLAALKSAIKSMENALISNASATMPVTTSS